MSRHHAPAVVYPVHRSRVLGCLLAVVWCSGVGNLALWQATASVSPWPLAAALFAVMVAGGFAGTHWFKTPAGQLTWDGEQWHWDLHGEPAFNFSGAAELSIVVDVQFALLLLFQTKGLGKRWIWVERASKPERWMDLRRALYAYRREWQAPTGAGFDAPPR